MGTILKPIATWMSGAIALAAVALGGLNAVAQFVTILFLTLYVTINMASALESLVGDPSYRPTIKVPWSAGTGSTETKSTACMCEAA